MGGIMTKLEEKLTELGYNKTSIENRYIKIIDCSKCICIWVENKEKIYKTYVIDEIVYSTQQDIDNLQQAFDEMQKDLEILRSNYE